MAKVHCSKQFLFYYLWSMRVVQNSSLDWRATDFSALFCLPPQRTCTCCTPWWPWTSVGTIWHHHLTFHTKLPLSCAFRPSTAFHHREVTLVAPLDGPEHLRGSNLRSPKNLVGPINIDTMGIRSPRYSMRLFSPGEEDSPLLDLLGFAAGKKTRYMFCLACYLLSR